MQTVWETRFLSSSFIISIIICILIITLSIAIFVKINRRYVIIVRCVCALVCFYTVFVAIFGLFTRYDEWRYAENNRLVIAGEIENFVSGNNGTESFVVKGVSFSYPTSVNLIGYDIPQRDSGSVIDGNGQYVRLTYYNRAGENYIIKIETINQIDQHRGYTDTILELVSD